MAEAALPRRPQRSGDLERRPMPDDYRSENAPRMTALDAGSANYSGKPRGPAQARDHQDVDQTLRRGPLHEIATLLVNLTYGEMIELADALWKAQPEGTSITKDNLPALLHKWSTSL